MNPEQTQIKQEINNEQSQINNNVAVHEGTGQDSSKDVSPAIKTEENQANWKAFREQRERERKEREDALRKASEKQAEAEALKAALEAAISKPNYYNQPQQDQYNEESEDQKIEKRVRQIIEEREKKAEIERIEKEKQEAPKKILKDYPDFERVCNQENCDYLDYHHPEITAPFKHMPDGYEKWSMMYKVIKKLIPNTDATKEMARADKNLNKPGSISTPGGTQGQSAMPSAKLDEARKAANWERMQKAIKGLS